MPSITKTCSVEDCQRVHAARGWCPLHYYRWQRNGDPTIARVYKTPAAICQFSPEDSDLADIRWFTHPSGYAQRHNGNLERLAHRVVLERKIGRKLQPGELCDHINRDKLDNRRENLRVADKSLNSINRDMRPDNTSGYIGVYQHWPKAHKERGWRKTWKGIVHRNNKVIFCRYFPTPEEASIAREAYIQEHHL